MNMYNPYIQQMPQTQDLGGLSPVFQNIAQQQAMQQAALQQGMDLTNQAGMTVDGKQAGAGYSQLAMANALRKQDPNQQTFADKMGVYAKSIPAIMEYGAENVYGGFGRGQVPTMTTGEN
jgi:hypothetical protein